jgi:TRAP-type mannitol/chloroaromatic compound transport system permease large subunit
VSSLVRSLRWFGRTADTIVDAIGLPSGFVLFFLRSTAPREIATRDIFKGALLAHQVPPCRY